MQPSTSKSHQLSGQVITEGLRLLLRQTQIDLQTNYWDSLSEIFKELSFCGTAEMLHKSICF